MRRGDERDDRNRKDVDAQIARRLPERQPLADAALAIRAPSVCRNMPRDRAKRASALISLER